MNICLTKCQKYNKQSMLDLSCNSGFIELINVLEYNLWFFGFIQLTIVRFYSNVWGNRKKKKKTVVNSEVLQQLNVPAL